MPLPSRCRSGHLTLLLVLAGLAPAASFLRAQAPSPNPEDAVPSFSEQSQPNAAHTSTIVVKARLVILDVNVTDKDGKPVTGLTEKDFQVLEDNKPQRIRSVELPTAHTLPEDTAAQGISAVFDPAKPANFGRTPVTVLVLDQINTHFADSSFARRQLHDYLTRQPAVLAQPTTLLSIYDNNFKILHGFTRDRAALLHALEEAPVKYAWELETNGKADHGPIDRLDQSLRALEEIAQDYAAIQGRKNLIWVGGGFPKLDPGTLDTTQDRIIRQTLQHVTDVLLSTRVTLYAVDPSSSAQGMTEITNDEEMMFASAAGDNLSAAADPWGSSDDFDALGPITGGRVIRGRNDVAKLVANSVDLGNTFYTIAYTPSSDSDAATKFRNIKIVVLRPGLTATTRRGYFSGAAEQENTAATAAYDLTTAAEGPMPLNGLHVTVLPDPSATAPPETYIVRVDAASLNWAPNEDGSSKASVYVLAVSLTSKNKMLGHTLHGMNANAKPGTNLRDPARMADFVFTAPAVPKAAKLRFIVRDSATGRMGSFDMPLQH